ncbi:MAG TPA: FecR family protein [Rariglobus sp.]|jgi:hypothetical protein|nr:FecR family protein [Rariglobus sp.]
MRLYTFFSIFGLALLTALNLPAQTVRVIFVSGQAELQRPDEATAHPALKGESVIIGTRISTGADGRVVLTPMPGVKSMIAPNTIVVLESASDSHPSATEVKHQATLDLKVGAVVSDLQKQPGATFDYSIRTPRGLAGARGTTFTVGLNDAGIQTIVVSHGTISLTLADGRTISLTIGQVSITQPGGETQHAAKISDLSPEDQALAEKWVKTTIETLLGAIEAGIEIQPDALQNALDAAKNLGITLSPELQARVDQAKTLLPETTPLGAGTDTKTTTDVITEQNTITGFASIEAFIASLDESQQYVFAQLRETGYTDAALTKFLSDKTSADGIVNLINLDIALQNYDIPNPISVLCQLGILGNDNFTVVGADTDGLRALILGYSYSDNSNIYLADESNYPKDRPVPTDSLIISGSSYIYGYSNIFFPGTSGHSGMKIYNVTFDTYGSSNPQMLYVGATRKLIIDNSALEGDTFITNSGDAYGQVNIRASDLIDLNGTRFSSDVSGILIEAATINLSNINFTAGTQVNLNSKYGSVNFGSSKYGKVNFISKVSYDGTPLTPDNFSDGMRGAEDVTGGNVRIGTLLGMTPSQPQ